MGTVAASAFIHSSAVLLGDVTLGEHASVWPGAVLRGDVARIEIGDFTNIQDLSVVHVDLGEPCRVGRHVVCGHRVVLHACTIDDEVLVGMGAIVLNGARVKSHTILGAGCLVPEGKELAGGLYVGIPARRVRDLTGAEVTGIRAAAERYAELAEAHRSGAYEPYR